MQIVQYLLQIMVILLAATAMYLMNCAKTAQARPPTNRAPLIADTTRDRIKLLLTDFEFTDKWGRLAFFGAIVALVLNLLLSSIRAMHH